MSCKQWNDEWVARLYGELDPAEDRRLTEHLEACQACSDTLEELGSTREMLSHSAPQVPAAPRVVMLQPKRRFLQPVWSFAAGVACAALIFVAGLVAAPRLVGSPSSAVVPAAVEQRLASLERARAEQRQLGETLLTRREMEQRIDSLTRDFEVTRARDVTFLMEEMAAVEMRTGSRIKTNRNAVRFALLASNPNLSER